MAEWINACGVNDVDEEDVIRFDHGTRTYIIVRDHEDNYYCCLLYTSPSPRDRTRSRMPSSA